MKLFKLKKSKTEESCCESKKDCCNSEESKDTACCQVDVDSLKDAASPTDTKGIRVLGTGCAKCKTLEKNTIDALSELNMEDQVEKVTDLAQIATYGVMSTPALWVDGKVVSFGKVLSKDEVINHIKKVR